MRLDEGTFQRALEVELCAPRRLTRVRRINSGEVFLENRDGSRRRFRGAQKGTGDLVGFAAPDGLHVEVEAKAHDGVQSPAQKRRQRAVRKAGAVYLVVVADPDVEQLEASVERAVREVDEAIAAARRKRRT